MTRSKRRALVRLVFHRRFVVKTSHLQSQRLSAATSAKFYCSQAHPLIGSSVAEVELVHPRRSVGKRFGAVNVRRIVKKLSSTSSNSGLRADVFSRFVGA